MRVRFLSVEGVWGAYFWESRMPRSHLTSSRPEWVRLGALAFRELNEYFLTQEMKFPLRSLNFKSLWTLNPCFKKCFCKKKNNDNDDNNSDNRSFNIIISSLILLLVVTTVSVLVLVVELVAADIVVAAAAAAATAVVIIFNNQ